MLFFLDNRESIDYQHGCRCVSLDRGNTQYVFMAIHFYTDMQGLIGSLCHLIVQRADSACTHTQSQSSISSSLGKGYYFVLVFQQHLEQQEFAVCSISKQFCHVQHQLYSSCPKMEICTCYASVKLQAGGKKRRQVIGQKS